MTNVLSAIQQPAYHFAFYASPDSIRPNFSGPNQGLLLAETGSTETNIASVEMTTYSGITPRNLNNSMVMFQMKLVEPMGATFFDKLAQAGQFSDNWMKTAFILMLKFHGYDPYTGQYIDDPVGRSWTWKIKINKIDVDIHAGGTTYILDMLTYEDIGVLDHFNVLGDGFTGRGKTVGEHFASLKQHMMTSQMLEYGMIRHNIDFVVHPITQDMGFVIPEGDPNSWKIMEPNDETQLKRAESIDAIPEETHIGTNPIDTISSIATAILANTIEGQQLITRSMDPTKPSNKAPNAAVWKVFTETTVRSDLPYDFIDDDYNYNIVYHIVPHITFGGILATEQRDDAENPQSVQAKIALMQQQGRLVKEYDYLFTGLNTEVINADIKFNAAFKAYTPRNESVSHSTFVPEMLGNEQFDIQRANMVQQILGMIRGEMVKNAGSGRGASDPYMQGLFDEYQRLSSEMSTLTSNLSRLYPQSFDRETSRTRSEFAGDAETNIQQGKSNYRLFIAQYMSVRPVMMELDLTIKGDPYWIGPSSHERMTGGQGVVEPFKGDNALVLNMIIPDGIRGDGSPNLYKSNMFSGLYNVHTITSTFSNGKFVQTLSCIRNTNAIIKD